MTNEQIEQLSGEISEYIDTDPRFCMIDEGDFKWAIFKVHYKKLDDRVFFEVEGVTYETDRP